MMGSRNRGLVARMIGAARLDVATYEDVERDRNATGQAAQVVLIAAVAGAIGGAIRGSILAAILGILLAFISWIVWSYVAYYVGKTLFKTTQTRVTPGEMLRTIGFAQSPGVFSVLAFIPIVPLIVFIWQVVAGVIAIRQAMDFDTGRAIGTALVSAIPSLIIIGIFIRILL